jgi:hypothetical protein
MVTGYEVQMYADIRRIADALNRIANCAEAAELRARPVRAAEPHTHTIAEWWAAMPPYVREHMAGNHVDCPPAECDIARIDHGLGFGGDHDG